MIPLGYRSFSHRFHCEHQPLHVHSLGKSQPGVTAADIACLDTGIGCSEQPPGVMGVPRGDGCPQHTPKAGSPSTEHPGCSMLHSPMEIIFTLQCFSEFCVQGQVIFISMYRPSDSGHENDFFIKLTGNSLHLELGKSLLNFS